MAVAQRWSRLTIAPLLLVASSAAAAEPTRPDPLEPLVGQLAILRQTYLERPALMPDAGGRPLVRDALAAVASGDWQRGRASLGFLLAAGGLTPVQRSLIELELGLAEERSRAVTAAAARYRSVAAGATYLAPLGIERLLRLAEAEPGLALTGADWARYEQLTRHEADGEHASAMRYRWVRWLARAGQPIGGYREQLDRSAYERRFRYLLAVQALRAGDSDGALALFDAVLALPAPPGATGDEDELQVIDLARLARARLLSERGEATLANASYLELRSTSPWIGESFYELGWVSLEGGRPKTATAAFSALAEMDLGGVLGLKAQLMQGMVLLGRGDLDGALAYYPAARANFRRTLNALFAELKTLSRPLDLARDCENRRRAMAQPFLAEVIANPRVRQVYHDSQRLEAAAALMTAERQLLETLQAFLDGSGAANPIARYDFGIAQARQALVAAQQLMAGEQAQHGWPGPRYAAGDLTVLPDTEACCQTTAARARSLVGQISTTLAELQTRRDDAREHFLHLQDRVAASLDASQTAYSALRERVEHLGQAEVAAAIAEEQQRILELIIETETGELEALWRKKVAAADDMTRLGIERQQRLVELRHGMAASLGELEELLGVVADE